MLMCRFGKAAGSAVVALVLGCVVLGSAAQAQLHIEITRGVERPVPLAIVPFAWEGPGETAPFDMAALITANLRNSGRFDPMDQRDMLSRPSRPEQVSMGDWRIVNVDYLVIGRLIEDGPNRYTAVFQLYDVLRGDQLTGFRLSSSGEDLRATGHRISDMIFQELTGIPGVFGTRIAYVNEERQSNQSTYYLIVSDADGENARVIAESNQPLMSPAWSPDGRRLAYVSFEGNQSAIYVQTLRTGTRERVSARAGVNGAPAWSPDGRKLALTLSLDEGALNIYTLDLGSQMLTRLTNTPSIDTEPVWSRDGQYIYFTSDRAGGPQIYRVQDRPGSRAERVTYEGNYNARPRVSPDGTQLAVIHNDRGNMRIALVDIRTGVTQVLSSGRNDESPDFSPNGAAIIYATREGGRGVLASVSTDGRIRLEIASVDGQVREPVWGPFPLP
jgi:TolB protein